MKMKNRQTMIKKNRALQGYKSMNTSPVKGLLIIAILFASLYPIAGSAQTVTETVGDFKLYSNGIITCVGAADGDSAIVSGTKYFRRTKAEIKGTVSLASSSCTTGITDMSSIFSGKTGFNQDISSWDVSNVTNMVSMFSQTFNFNQDLSNWDVSNVTTMYNMFDRSLKFTSDLSNWDVSNVTDMRYMFYTARAFNADIRSWDVSSVQDMETMFNSALAFDQDLSPWCVSLISSSPPNFGNSGTDPVWGTCPTIPRVITGNAGWRLLSFPISGGKVSDISDDTAIQGITGGLNTASAANFYTYDVSSSAFVTPTNVSTAIADGNGFIVYFYNNTTGGSSTLPIKLFANGTEPSSNVDVTLNATASGFSLVGNPFTSNFSTNVVNMAVSGGGIQNTIQLWNNATSSYSSVDRTTPYIVAPWQGFWVERDAVAQATTLTFSTAGETTTAATGEFFSKEVSANRGDINFTFSSENSYDEAIRLSFRDNATFGYDADDAGKLIPLLSKYAIMAFNSNELNKSVESLPWNLTEEVTIPMEEVLVGVDGGFTLEWKGFESIPPEWTLTFHDYETGSTIDMRVDNSYAFDANAPAGKINAMNILTGAIATPLKSKLTEGTRF
jgi:surface protein